MYRRVLFDVQYVQVCATDGELADGYSILPETYPAFDNFFKSFLTVFVATTLEGWQDIMYR